MKPLRLLDAFRDRTWERDMGGEGDDHGGCFKLRSDHDGGILRVIASSGEGWDHVSVSRGTRCPVWAEMEQVKRLFFKDEEVALQLHVPPADHISVHPNCLHIWRPQDHEIPRPPTWMIA